MYLPGEPHHHQRRTLQVEENGTLHIKRRQEYLLLNVSLHTNAHMHSNVKLHANPAVHSPKREASLRSGSTHGHAAATMVADMRQVPAFYTAPAYHNDPVLQNSTGKAANSSPSSGEGHITACM